MVIKVDKRTAQSVTVDCECDRVFDVCSVKLDVCFNIPPSNGLYFRDSLFLEMV